MAEPETHPEREAAEAITSPAKPAAKGSGPVGTVVAIAVVLVIFGFVAFGHHGSSHDGGALIACEGFVKDDLKSPGSARFSDEDLTSDGSTYTLTGTVDSDNSFGAPIRNDFTCVASYDSNSDEFTLVSMGGLTN